MDWRIVRFVIGAVIAIASIVVRGGSGSQPQPADPQSLLDGLPTGILDLEADTQSPSVNDYSLTLSELDATEGPGFDPEPLTEFVTDKPVIMYRDTDAWEPSVLTMWPPTFVQFENGSDNAIIIEFSKGDLAPLRVPANGSSSIDFGRNPPAEYTFHVQGGEAAATIDARSPSQPRTDAGRLKTVTIGSGRLSVDLPDDPGWEISTAFNGLVMKPADDSDPNGSFQRYLASRKTPWTSGLSIFLDPSGFTSQALDSTTRAAMEEISIDDCSTFTTGQAKIGDFTGREKRYDCKPVSVTFFALRNDQMDGVIYVTVAGISKSEHDRLVGYLETIEFSNEIMLTDISTAPTATATKPLSNDGKVARLDIVDNQFGEFTLHEGIGWDSPIVLSHFGGEPVDVYINEWAAATLVEGYSLTIPFDWIVMPRAFVETRVNPFLRSWVVIEIGDFPDYPTDWYSSNQAPTAREQTYTIESDETEVAITLTVPDGWNTKDGTVRYRRDNETDPAIHAWYAGNGETPRIDQWALWTWKQPEYLSLDIDSPYAWTVARFVTFDGQVLTVAQTYYEGTSVSVEVSSGPDDHALLVTSSLIPSIESLRIEY